MVTGQHLNTLTSEENNTLSLKLTQKKLVHESSDFIQTKTAQTLFKTSTEGAQTAISGSLFQIAGIRLIKKCLCSRSCDEE